MRVFVYGTLTDPDRLHAVDPAGDIGPPATLVGADRLEGRYPTIVPGDGSVEGRLAEANLEALDAYEGVERGLYARVSVPTGESVPNEAVETYVGDPARLGVAASWPGDGSLSERAGAYLREHAVVRFE